MILEVTITMNPFKNISIFRNKKSRLEDKEKEWEFWPNNPKGSFFEEKKDTKPWSPRPDYRELNDDPELKPTPFPEKQQYDMDYKYLLEENMDYKSLLEEGDRALGNLLEEIERLEVLVKSLILQLDKKEKEFTALFDDGRNK